MANYLRPRRGKRATAESQNIILKKGEIFFEAPDAGVGKGAGRIKIGDGVTAYTSLPYFYDYSSFVTDLANSTISFTPTTETNNTVLLNKIVSGAKVSIIIAAIKNLLVNINNSVSSLITEKNKYVYSSAVSCPVAATTCTINSTAITSNSLIEIFANNPSGDVLYVENVEVTTGKAVLTFEALEEATSFKLRISNI